MIFSSHFFDQARAHLRGHAREYGVILLALFVTQAVCYSYLFTGVIFTNHTLPNVWVFQYPSFKTTSEGRWLADIIIMIQGGSGAQSFLMVLAALVQGVNGILLAVILSFGNKRMFLVGALLCLYPAFLDYYSFSIDHLAFVGGDTLVLVGTLIYLNQRSIRWRLFGTLIPYTLALAAYQPKLSLISCMAIIGVLLKIIRDGRAGAQRDFWRSALGEILLMALIVCSALAVYWATLKLSISFDNGDRTHVNTLAEIIAAVPLSYMRFAMYFSSEIGSFPSLLRHLPVLGMSIGAVFLLFRLWRVNRAGFVIGLLGIAVLPVALSAPYLINSKTWEHSGRVIAANGYLFVIFTTYGLHCRPLEKLSGFISFLCLYFFVVLSTQQSNAAALKTVYDLNFMNRILARAELCIPENEKDQIALVVAGNYPDFDRKRYVRNPPLIDCAHIFMPTFVDYRQIEMLNFLAGSKVFRRPTRPEREAASACLENRKPWPAPESVFLHDKMLVVLLEPYHPGIALTWTVDQ